MTNEELPSIVVNSERDGYRAKVPALGDDVIFGPSVNIGDVVAAARQAVFNHLRAVLPGPNYPFTPLIVAPGTTLRAHDVLALIAANRVSEKLNLSRCYLALVNLSRAALHVELARWRATKEDDHPPWRSVLNEGMCLSDSVLHRTYLSNANLDGADLTMSELTEAFLMGANLDGALLWHSDLRGAFIHGTSFRGADFLGAHLERVDLYDANLGGAFWRGALLDRTRMRRERLGTAIGEELAAKGQKATDPARPGLRFHDAREAYLALKTNFESVGRYDDASWAYVKEQQMEKAMYFPTTTGHKWIRERMGGAAPPAWWGPGRLPRWMWWKLRSAFYHSRLFLGLIPREGRQEMVRRDTVGSERDEWLSRWRWLRNWGYELVTGYGERPWNTVATGLTMVLAFALGFWASGIADSHSAAAFLDCLIYSFATFATFNLSRPVLNPEGRGIEVASSLEAVLGVGVLALVIFTLGNRMRRS